ncbi:WD repeat-containing protein 55 isoform X2 [Pangasianodon hypophthalmus]|uniref:WD repeat-containing protein 55 isoform X2 n=1 Tax=Pangasianodon hypophthalmus TaxID=310915 RepID=UPI0023074272|nr:WD repeat-containing protein 55 isoform X2 [Pangasianodon hypophthalmus]
MATIELKHEISPEEEMLSVFERNEETSEPQTQKLRETPEDIKQEAIINSLAFHPKEDILAAGDVDGDIYLYRYSCNDGENKELWSSGHHLKSCRKVAFTSDGEKLFSVSKDKAVHIMDVVAGKLVKRIPKAHSKPINALLLVDENVVATGDDEGTLKVWDMRKSTSFMSLKHHEDYISDIVADPAKRTLLTSSGDGTMGVINLKKRRFELLSEIQDGDLTSVSIMKHGRKVVCGSSEGMLYIFNWNGFGATSDRFALQAETVDCIVPITDSILCTGSMDGVISGGSGGSLTVRKGVILLQEDFSGVPDSHKFPCMRGQVLKINKENLKHRGKLLESSTVNTLLDHLDNSDGVLTSEQDNNEDINKHKLQGNFCPLTVYLNIKMFVPEKLKSSQASPSIYWSKLSMTNYSSSLKLLELKN